jgi:hypothetical protein
MIILYYIFFYVIYNNRPLPVELIVVIVGTVLSYFLKFNEVYEVKIVGKIVPG